MYVSGSGSMLNHPYSIVLSVPAYIAYIAYPHNTFNTWKMSIPFDVIGQRSTLADYLMYHSRILT